MKYLSIAFPIPVYKNFFYCCEQDVELGSRVRVLFGRIAKIGYVVEVLDEQPSSKFKIKLIKEVIDKKSIISPSLMKLASIMSEYYVCSLGEILSVILPVSLLPTSRKYKSEIEKDGILEPGFILSSQQKNVIGPILSKAQDGVFERFLVHGVTDSGKTEIYANLIERLVKSKKQVIILVPEIAIITQLVERLRKRFTIQKVGVWHSRISKSEKMDCIERIRNGNISILVGTRSAVFAPFSNLGAIIIDEEQDPSYKQYSSPYYDARWIAEKRCLLEKSLLILGTATPSIETLFRTRKGELKYLKISERIHQTEFPELVVVDMKREYSERFPGAIFSKYLLDTLRETINNGRQSIIFLNRRGYSRSVICMNCGESIKCPNCNIIAAYHSVQNELICHLCGKRMIITEKCTLCGGTTYKYSGAGTQRVEKALKKLFPESRISRMDMDAILKKGTVEEIFRKFEKGKVDIIVGTQIIAKGWDFSNVDLVGIINSDIGLMMPDFRAAENTFSLLKQVAGRTGRGKNRGKVVVQTFNPNYYAIKMLFGKNYDKFYDKEIEIRRNAQFPPFSKLINIVSTHPVEKKAQDNIDYCRDFIGKNISGVSLLGPAPAPRYKIGGKYRWQLLIKYHENRLIKEKLKEMIVKKPYKSRLKIDVDPYDMM